MAMIVFRNCAVFDGVSETRREGASVVVENDRIREVSDRPVDIAGAVEVDVGGRTLMPGLIDAHVHVFAVNVAASKNEAMPLTLMTAMAVPRIQAMLDRGFTSVRDVAGGDVGIRDAVAQGYIKGPRLFVGGPALSETGGHCDHRRRTDDRYDIDYNANALVNFARIVDGPDEMRRMVRNELRKGADHIKVMASGGVGSPSDPLEAVQFTQEELRVAAEEAGKRGKYVCAHTYTSPAIRHAVEAGIRTVEHANFIDEETARFVASRGAYVVPTLVCYDITEKNGERMGLTPVVMEKLRAVNNAGIAMLEVCERAGATMGFGTDIMGELNYAQSDEFAIRGRVQKPIDILRSATSINAEILQKKGELGVVAPGALADLVIVDGNPLADINLLAEPAKNLSAIVKGGELYMNRLPIRERAARAA